MRNKLAIVDNYSNLGYWRSKWVYFLILTSSFPPCLSVFPLSKAKLIGDFCINSVGGMQITVRCASPFWIREGDGDMKRCWVRRRWRGRCIWRREEMNIAVGRWRYRYKAIKCSYYCANILAHRCTLTALIGDADQTCCTDIFFNYISRIYFSCLTRQ